VLAELVQQIEELVVVVRVHLLKMELAHQLFQLELVAMVVQVLLQFSTKEK
jgi:hypothetical protein